MKSPDIAVIGGGLLGRLLAWRAAREGLKVALYDKASRRGEASAAWAAAGMVTPSAEAIEADMQIVAMGRRSLALWPQWLAELPQPVFYRDAGTLMFWHHHYAGEAHRFEARLKTRAPEVKLQRVDKERLAELEPGLNMRFNQGFYLPQEAQIDNRELLSAVAEGLEESKVPCYWETTVSETEIPNAGCVVDCRGMGAKRNWTQLRGIRGEMLRLYAPELELHHMLRLLHPRYAVYIVPRANGRLVIGATSIESDDRSEVSVRGALELLSSAYFMLPALAEGRILEFNTQVRPTLPDNLPAFRYDKARRILRINGLYRHGFLLSPAVIEDALAVISSNEPSEVALRWPCLRLADTTSNPEIHSAANKRQETCLSS
jgi:glycine oxidase